ncbi:MAG: GGDEF domain-containing protein [Pseudomonadales bacterium]|nr:GGDEF domain-containing protein [Pseudomonadales bacterium]
MSLLRSVTTSVNTEPSVKRQQRQALRAPLELQLTLPRLLGGTLDRDLVLQRFHEIIGNDLDIAHLDLIDDAEHYRFSRGTAAGHQLCYQLKIENEHLATLTMTRSLPFNEQEMIWLEQAIVHLLMPLKHALQYAEALEQAMSDGLTGLGNRRAMNQALNRCIRSSHRYERVSSLLMLDIDHFKNINDKHGHAMGDHVLTVLAQTLHSALRLTDQAFRYGGEEFIILLPEASMTGARIVAERLRQAIDGMDIQGIFPTVSIGLACLRPDDNLNTWLNRTDQALYQAKRQGRNRIVDDGQLTD